MRFLTITVLLLTPALAAASNTELSLSKAEQIALQNNPALAAAGKQAAAMAEIPP